MLIKRMCLLLLVTISIQTVCVKPKKQFLGIKVDTLLSEKISIRALSVFKNTVYYAADKNRIGKIELTTGKNTQLKVERDSIIAEFRSCAKTKNYFFALSIANPALLYRFSADLKSKKLVYTEQNDTVFYDSMQFYDEQNGIAIGDPIHGRMSIILTRDGGASWHKNTLKNAPLMDDGEAFFAASNSTISIKNGKTWVFSGGKKSRLFYSNDKGISWKTTETPIIQGEKMTGIFTSDFYNDKIGIVAGGNYEKPSHNYKNKAITFDGGLTWKLLPDDNEVGYSSCIQFFPESKGRQIVSVGLMGIYLSNNYGTTWIKVSTEKSLNTIRFITPTTAVAAGKNKIIKIKFY